MEALSIGKQKQIRNKLTWEQVQEIKKLHNQGVPRKEISKQFEIGQTSISKILNGLSWVTNWTKEL